MQNLDMPREEFVAQARRLADWIGDYLDDSQRYPVLHQVAPGEIAAGQPRECPQTGCSMQEILDDFERQLLPGLTHWNHPRFFAYFSISASAPGVLADFLSSALNQQAMLWRTSPAATELEQVALAWLAQMMGLPAWEGVIYDTASVSTLHALAAAREVVCPNIRQQGFSGPPLRVYCSDQTHNSIDKAVILLGMGLDNLRKIPSDDDFRMRPEALASAIEEDLAAGYRPCAVVATVGTTSTSSLDPVEAIADLCAQHKLWLHVDAAYGGAAALAPEFQPLFKGWERADSLVVNPHKWMFVPFDLSVLYCRDMDILRRAFSLVAEYLKTSDGEVKNLMDTGIQLGRRFRSLKLWMILRYFGRDGMAERIRSHIAMARQLADWIDEHPRFERTAPTPLSLVCFRAVPEGLTGPQVDEFNLDLMERLNARGEIFLSHTKLKDRISLRLAIGNIRTRPEHIRQAWEAITQAAKG